VKFLNLPQIGSAGQKVRGKAVPQGVRTDGGWNSGSAGIEFYQFPNCFPSKLPAAAGK